MQDLSDAIMSAQGLLSPSEPVPLEPVPLDTAAVDIHTSDAAPALGSIDWTVSCRLASCYDCVLRAWMG